MARATTRRGHTDHEPMGIVEAVGDDVRSVDLDGVPEGYRAIDERDDIKVMVKV